MNVRSTAVKPLAAIVVAAVTLIAVSGAVRAGAPAEPRAPVVSAVPGSIQPQALWARHEVGMRAFLNPAVHYGPVIFIDEPPKNDVRIFAAHGVPALLGVITDGVSGPLMLALDAAGTLYVVNSGSNSVTEYPRGSLTPHKMLTDNISSAFAIALGANGTVYVGNHNDGSIAVFPAHSMTSTVIDTGLSDLSGLALDQNGDIFIASREGTYEIPKGSKAPQQLAIQTLQYPYGVAFGPDGVFYVSSETGDQKYSEIDAFKQRSGKPYLTMNLGTNGQPSFMAITPGAVFISMGLGEDLGFRYNNSQPFEKIAPLDRPAGAGYASSW
jgi:DNA-binding beta-propeller fold protein YncE